MKVILSVLVQLLCIITCLSQVKKVDSGFARSPFGRSIARVDMKAFVGDSFKIESSLRKNQYTNEMDTLISFKGDSSTFSFLKTRKDEKFVKAIILSSSVSLAKGVHVGMSANAFSSIFRLKQTRFDSVVISDSSDYYFHAFFFRNGKLWKIVLDLEPD